MAYDNANTYETIELFGLTEKDAQLKTKKDAQLKTEGDAQPKTEKLRIQTRPAGRISHSDRSNAASSRC